MGSPAHSVYEKLGGISMYCWQSFKVCKDTTATHAIPTVRHPGSDGQA